MPDSNVITDLLTERDLAGLTHMSLGTIRRWRQFRRGPRYVKVEGAAVRYKREDVAAWLAGLPQGGGGHRSQQGG